MKIDSLVMTTKDKRNEGKKYKNDDDEQARRNGNLDEGKRQGKESPAPRENDCLILSEQGSVYLWRS